MMSNLALQSVWRTEPSFSPMKSESDIESAKR
jgi:hypothetical protein